MRLLASLALLALAPGCGRVEAPPTLGLSIPDLDLPGLVQALGSEDPRVRQDAGSRLRAKGEASLPVLKKAGTGKDASLAAQARRVSETIEEDLIGREREADDRFLEKGLPKLPEGTWAMVAQGRLAATGATRDAALDAGESLPARHRYLWKAGEPVAKLRAELSSLRAGDFGMPVLEALGRAPLVGLPGREDWAVLEGSAPEDWKEASVALGSRDALQLGLQRFEFPGIVTVRSRVGAGVLTRARRARAEARSADGSKRMDVTVWILETP